jgi:ATP-binding cassette subfamily F protein 3
VLRLEKISKIYPTGEVLKDVSWEIRNGERIGLVGVNGAGKSTQLKIIAKV